MGLGTLLGLGLGALSRLGAGKVPAPALLRPPGSRGEDHFLAACLRCGQCVQACPYGTLKLASEEAGISAGTPYLEPREIPCYLCRDHDSLLCIDACPSSALRPVEDITAVRMGTAAIDTARCLAYNGVPCRTCWHACPLSGTVIHHDALLRPVVDPEHCIGCGLCDHACLTEPSSIPIVPVPSARRALRTG